MSTVLYFNHWFSSIGNLIEDIKKENKDITIIASSKNKNCVYKDYVDVFIEEPDTDYINFTLDTCKKYNVNYFFVKSNSLLISEHADELSNIGVTLVCDSYHKLLKLNKKSDTYKELEKDCELKKHVPEYICSNDKLIMTRALDVNKNKRKICLKLNSDEGGKSFRKIKDDDKTINSLKIGYEPSITTEDAKSIIRSCDDSSDIILMERLNSPEISVDCYNSKKGFIAICRKKLDGRVQHIFYDDKISNICERICKTLELKFPFNVQFRYRENNDTPFIIDINPRLSGGIYQEVNVGLNLAKVCLDDLMCNNDVYNVEKFKNFKEIKVTHIEKSIVL